MKLLHNSSQVFKVRTGHWQTGYILNFLKFHQFIYTVESMNYEKGKGICVNVDLEYLTSKTAPASHYKVKFYFDKDKETKTYFIKDSEHFAMFDREAYIYKYAVLTGCLDELKDVTDDAE